MTATIKFEAVLPKKKNYPQQQLTAAVEALVNALEDDVANLIEKELDKTTKNWDHEVPFKHKISGVRKITLTVYPSGRYRKYWIWADQGTASRNIHSKGRSPMTFQTKYSPRTTPGGRRGGPGRKSGPYARTHTVRGHKIEARNFRAKVVKDVEKNVLHVLGKAFNKALSR